MNLKRMMMATAVAMSAMAYAADAVRLLAAVPTEQESVDGVTWSYSLANGCATVRGSSTTSAAIPTDTEGKVSIPERLGNCPVTEIADWAFYRCDRMTEVEFPVTVTNIGSHAFQYASSLLSVVIPNGVKEINANAFQYCSALTNAVLPNGVKTVGNYAFANCEALEIVALPESLDTVGAYAFAGDTKLTGMTVPTGVTAIGAEAFRGCSGLTCMTLPTTVTSVGENAFSGCTGIKRVVLPGCLTTGRMTDVFPNCYATITNVTVNESARSIAQYAFQGCTGLKSISIADSVTYIGYQAFGGCYNLRAMHIPFVGTRRGNSETPEANFGYVFGRYSSTGSRNVTQYYRSGYYNTYYIPSNLTEVVVTDEKLLGYGAFQNCEDIKTVTMNEGVTNINTSAFSGCSRLAEIVIPVGVTNIQASAFYNCVAMTNAVISSSVQSIGQSAFSGCSRLNPVTIPEGVISLGSYAFSGCVGAREVSLPSTLRTINEYAFQNCTGLRGITVPNNVTYIGYQAFGGCFNLRAMHIPFVGTRRGNNETPEANFGYVFGSYSSTGSRNVTQYYRSGGYYNYYYIPSNLTEVVVTDEKLLGYGAFQNCVDLTNVVLNVGITSIGYQAFYNCTGLRNIVIPDGVTSIDQYAFRYCSNLRSVKIPDSIVSIGSSAFENCHSSLIDTTTVPNVKLVDRWAVGYTGTLSGDLDLSGVRGIGYSVFSGCTGLTSVTLPDDMETIGASAFSGCSNLKRVTMANGVTSIGSYAFSSCSSLTDVSIPSSVTNIENYAFQYCSSLINISLPEGLMAIGQYAFAYCSKLASVTIPSTLSTIKVGAFASDTKITTVNITDLSAWCSIDFADYDSNPTRYTHALTLNGEVLHDITIPDDVCKLRPRVFTDNYALTSVVVSEEVTEIPYSAFIGCHGITNVVLSSTVTDIGSYAFRDCMNLPYIALPVGVTNIANYAFSGYGVCMNLAGIDIPEGCRTIGVSAFQNCTNLTAVVVPSTVVDISDSVFRGCSSLRDVQLPSSVTNIRAAAFQNCRSLTEIELPTNLKAIGASAFQDDTGLIRVMIPEGVTSIGDNAFYGCTNMTEVILPSTLRTIGQYAFYNCRNLTSVVIPEGVTSIGQYAFNSCSSLSNVTIPQSVTSIGQYAFNGCNDLNVTIADGVTSIPNSVFSGCAGLSSVTIPSSVTTIGDNAFYNCSNLSNPTIPSSVTSIGSYAFYGCSKLTDVVIPEGVTSLGTYAFANCANLESVSLPSSLRSVGQNAFSGCNKLKSLAIADGITNIGQNAFAGCSNLETVTIPSTVTSIGSYAFQNCRKLQRVDVPSSVLDIGTHAFDGCMSLVDLSLAASVTNIGSYAFSACSNLTSLTIPKSVRKIGSSAFSGCVALTNATILTTVPERVSYATLSSSGTLWKVLDDGSYQSSPIGHSQSTSMSFKTSGDAVTLSFDWKVSSESGYDYLTFYLDNSSYNSVSGTGGSWQNYSIPLNAGSHTLRWTYSKDGSATNGMDCGWVRNVSLSGRPVGGGMDIGSNAFSGCTGLVSVATDDLTAWCGISFGNEASNPLKYSHRLFVNDEEVTSLSVPDGTKTVMNWCFDGCSSITNISLPDGLQTIGAGAFRRLGISELTLPESVVNIGSSAFAECTNMIVFVAHSNIENLGTLAFSGCGALKSVTVPVSQWTMAYWFENAAAQLEDVVISEGSGKVVGGAFNGCSRLHSIKIPASVTNVANNAFIRCPSLNGILVAADNAHCKDVDGVLYSKDGARIICCPAGVSGAYALPDEVTTLGPYAFNGCNKITGISIPAGLTELPRTAFEACSSLVALIVADENAVFQSIYGVVFTKDGKTLVLCPPGFKGNYKIPDGVTDIADNAFAGCVHLTGVTFPSSMRKVGTSAFEGCSALSDVCLNENLDEIGSYAFRNCASLTSLTVPDAVIKLGKDAFVGCTALTNLVLPEGLQLEPEVISGTINGTRTLSRGVVYHVTGNLTISSGATLNIPSGAILKMASGVQITVNGGGTLNAQGTRSSPIIFTSIKDDSVGGDTNGDGDASHAESGDWRYVWVYGVANFEYAQILYGGMADGSYGERGPLMTGGSGSLRMNGCLIAHSLYDGIWNWGGSVVAKNCIITDTGWAAAPYNGSRNEYINCVFYDNDVVLCYWSHWSGRPIFKNCIFAECGRGWCEVDENTYGDMPSAVTVKNSLFWNSRESGAQSCGLVGENGNIWGDPLFADDNYRISIESPCVDAGDGKVAPSADYFGQTRQNIYEDATGTPDVDGNYPDIGIHEVMPRVVENDIDLAVTNVEPPETFVVGQKATVSWTVKNLGSKPASGSWNDTVELVCANGSIIPLGTLPVSVELAAGGTRTFSGTFTVPSAQVGAVRVRVTTNANRDIFEGTLTANNVAESEAATLTMPELAFSDAGIASFNVAANGSVGYRLGAGFAEGGLLIVHVASATVGGVKAWTGNGQVPTADIFYAAAVEVGGGDYLVRVPAGGDAYVSFANEGSGLAKVDVGTETGAFLLFDTGVVTAPNEGAVSLTLYGNGFEGGMEAWIERGGTRLSASEIAVFDPVKAVATFDVSGLEAGAYEVHVKKGGVEDAASLLALTQQKVGPKWSCKLDIASNIRSSREYVGYLEYANSGDMPLDAPYVKITAGSGSFIRFGASDAWGDTLELMATSETYPASQLKPGETRRIPFRYKTAGSSLSIECGYTQEDAGAFPWDTNAAYMRPSWASDELWGLSLAVLKSNVGATWNDYLARMRANCDHLAKLGQPTHRLDRIWQLEINEALGVDHAVSTLASNTDLARSGRGFGLALSRSYGSELYRRLRKGIFGYGWSDNYSAYAELQNSGATLALHSGSGSTYLFEKVNGKWTPEDARDKTTCTESSSEYVLTYRSGTVQRIAKSNMRVSSVTDNQGNSLTFTYNADKQLVKVEHCDGQSLSFTYAGGLLASATDDQGRTTRYEYSGDMLVKVTAFNGLSTQYRYLPADGSVTSRALRQIAYADGTTRDFTYGADGFVATMATNGDKQMTRIAHTSVGEYSITAPNGGVSSSVVGWAGEQLQSVNALNEKTTVNYTADGMLDSLVGSTGKRAKVSYDEDGQMVKSVDAGGVETGFGSTSDYGRLSSVTDARGNVFKYGYDNKGRLISIEYADGFLARIKYSDRGVITNSVNRRGQSISYTYDREGRMLSKVWENGRTFTWAYNGKGNCTNATDSLTGTVTMEYDENERLVRIVHPKGRGFAYTYDSLGRTTSRTTLTGGSSSSATAADIQKYEYDSLGRLFRMTDGDGNLYVEKKYDETTGWLITQTYGNGTIVSNAYDILGRTIGIYHLKQSNNQTIEQSSNQILAFFEYAYDDEGRRISQTTAEGVERYTYDTVGQLTDVIYPDGSEEHFTYDAVGNRIAHTGTTGILPVDETYTANNLNQYTSAGTATFTYDLDGNLTSKTTPTDGTTLYSYDIQNRLVAVTNTTKDIAWSCEYDVFGNRTKVIDHGTAKETLFVQGSLPSAVADYDGEGTVATRHILLGSVRLADLTTNHSSLTTKYYHSDGLASTRLLTDAKGETAGMASYYAFGEIRTSSGDVASANWIGTIGVERDTTGLIFMRNRYYDVNAGRFIQFDATGLNAGHANLYIYCANDPVDHVDISGHDFHDFLSGANFVGNTLGMVAGGAAVALGAVAVVAGAVCIGAVLVASAPAIAVAATAASVAVSCGTAAATAGTWAIAGTAISVTSHAADEVLYGDGYTSDEALGDMGSIAAAHLGGNSNPIIKGGATVVGTVISANDFVGNIDEMYGDGNNGNPRINQMHNKPRSENSTSFSSEVRVSYDPNEMSGPAGVGAQRYVKPGEPMDYTIYFENQTNATAAAIKIAVTLPKDANLDWSTLELGEVVFGDHTDDGFVKDKSARSSVFPLAGTSCEVRTTVTENDDSVTWNLRIWDPNTTDHFPDDFTTGILPPNDKETHCGEGHLSYRVKLKENATPGSIVNASASIVFDDNPAIVTDPAWWNTVAQVASVKVNGDVEGDVTDLDLIVGLPYGKLPTPKARAGYTFGGWYTGPNGTGREVKPDSIVQGGDEGLYAKWVACDYTVHFYANGGTGTMYDQGLKFDEEAKLKANEFEFEGYSFGGWATNETGAAVFADCAVVSNLTAESGATVNLYATWTVNSYTVAFDANGGEGGWSSNLVYGAEIIAPTVTRECYTFAGWQPAMLERVPANDVTFTALWTPIGDGNSGGDSDDNGNVDDGGDSGGDDTSTPSEPVVPIWTVTFNANGGTGAMSAQTFTNGVAQALDANAFTRFGYVLAGWATSKDGDVVYRDGQSIAVSAGTTLYAVWEEVKAGKLNTGFAKAQTVDGALYKGDVLVGTVQVKFGKIGKKGVKVSGTATLLIDGKVKKVTAKAVNVMLDATGRVLPVQIAFKEPIGAMTFEMAADGTFTLKNGNYVMADQHVGGDWSKVGAKVYVAAASAALPQGTIEELLPNGEPVIPKGGKRSFAKAASVKYAKDKATGVFDLVINDSKGTNRSAIKLTYTPKTGIFKGSFKVYAIQGGKLKKFTAKVIGVVVDGTGEGSATGPDGVSFAVTVE